MISLACLLAVATATKAQALAPAFLDSSNKITAWRSELGLPQSVKVSVGGLPVPVASVEPAGYISDSHGPDPGRVVVAGNFQHLFGGSDWQPSSESTRMTPRLSSHSLEFATKLSKGHWEYKIAVGGSWAENYGLGSQPGGDNIHLDVLRDGTPVRFEFNASDHVVTDSINQPQTVSPPSIQEILGHNLTRLNPVNVISIRLARRLTAHELTLPVAVVIDGSPPRPVFARGVLDEPAYTYSGADLGSRWSKSGTSFCLWCPSASSVVLALHTGSVGRRLAMRRGSNGSWRLYVTGNLANARYDYIVRSYGSVTRVPDISCFAATEKGLESVVVPSVASPIQLMTPKSSAENPGVLTAASLSSVVRSAVDNPIYEISVRDFTSNPTSAVKPRWRGKFLGLTQSGTSFHGLPTGLDYLKYLGVSAVQLMPIQMFNPAHSGRYNWGYETYLFNVPEHRYCTNPLDPISCVTETKQMVSALHRAGIRVNLDVVYNHSAPSQGVGSPFWEIAPYFYFRTNDRGEVLNESGVGNALDDDRPMVRNYIRDSLTHWAREYGIDGFRFDLMGMFHKRSILEWRSALDLVRRGIAMYGEPWTGGGPVRFQKGDGRGTHVGVFNDNFRNAIRGALDGPGPGFASGGPGSVGVERGLVGSIAYSSKIADFTEEPDETINYVSAHDNLTLRDKLRLSLPMGSMNERERALNLCNALVVLAQGVPFLEGGAELGRSKLGNRNSYDAGDSVNRFVWDRSGADERTSRYLRRLLALRRNHPEFRLPSASSIVRVLALLPEQAAAPDTVALEFEGVAVNDPWVRTIVIFHGGRQTARFRLPKDAWALDADGSSFVRDPRIVASGHLTLLPHSVHILHLVRTPDRFGPEITRTFKTTEVLRRPGAGLPENGKRILAVHLASQAGPIPHTVPVHSGSGRQTDIRRIGYADRVTPQAKGREAA